MEHAMNSLLETPEPRIRPFMEYENGCWFPVAPYALSQDGQFLEKMEFVNGRLYLTNNNGGITEQSIHSQNRLSVWKVEIGA